MTYLHETINKGKGFLGGNNKIGHMNKVNRTVSSVNHVVKKIGGSCKTLQARK